MCLAGSKAMIRLRAKGYGYNFEMESVLRLDQRPNRQNDVQRPYKLG